jgi:ribokinase
VAVIVVGSLNIDVGVVVARLPAPGETVLATAPPSRTPGGKGLNQAIAAARQGARTTLVGAVGDDDDGRLLLDLLRAEGVDAESVALAAGQPTGMAFITVDADGDNTIVVVAGANATLAAPSRPLDVGPGDVVLAQLEVPIPTVTTVLRHAHERGATTILNASPAEPLPADLLAAVDVLVVNEREAATTGLGPRTTIVTLGDRGARLHRHAPQEEPEPIPTIDVDAIDSTGAGDAFAGTLAAALDDGLDLDDALRRASIAGALTTTRRGAATAIPDRREIDGDGDGGYKP